MRPLIGSALALVFSAQIASAQTLDEAIAFARAQSPLIAAADARVDGAAARKVQARSALLPQISVGGQYARSEADFGNDPRFGFGQQSLEPRSAQATAQQLVFAGGSAFAGLKASKEALAAQEAERKAVLAALDADVADAYLGVVVAEAALVQREANLASLMKLDAQAQDRFNAGEFSKSDVAQTEARRAGAEAALARANASLAAAKANFIAVVGMTPDGLSTAELPPATPADSEAAVNAAMNANPRLIALAHQVEAARQGVKKAVGGRLPTVTVGAEATTIRDEFFPGYSADSVAVVARAKVPIFAGGRIGGEIKEAKAKLAEARAQETAMQRAVRNQVIAAFENHNAARLSATAAERQAQASELALNNIREEVRVGQRPNIDLLDAERDFLEARLGAINAKANVVVSAYRLNAAVGVGAE